MPVFPLAHKDVQPAPQLLKASGLPSTLTNLPSLTWHSTAHLGFAEPQPWQKVGIIFSDDLGDAVPARLTVVDFFIFLPDTIIVL
jgi:hypothetical protein